jgi:hypothetical protein
MGLGRRGGSWSFRLALKSELFSRDREISFTTHDLGRGSQLPETGVQLPLFLTRTRITGFIIVLNCK